MTRRKPPVRAVVGAVWFCASAAVAALSLSVPGCGDEAPRFGGSAEGSVAPPPPAVPDPGWDVPATDREWRYVVVHHSAFPTGGYRSIDNEHRSRRGWDGCGYHFVIGNGTQSGDGQVEIGRRWVEQKHGAHAGTGKTEYNQHGIGICLVGDFSHRRPSPAQMEALVRLTRWLMARCDIPPDRVIGHESIRNTECPGRMFPWDDFRARLGPAGPTKGNPQTQTASAAP